MDYLTIEDLKRLVEEQQEPCLSLYMPSIRAGKEIRQNPIRFKNLLKDAEEQFLQAGYRRTDVDSLLEPAYDLLNNQQFWEHMSDGFAMFLSGEITRSYRLPLEFDTLATIAECFFIKPLLPLFMRNGRYFILALSQDSVRLMEGTRFSVDELDLGKTPTNLPEALQWDDPEEQIQHHATQGESQFGGEHGSIHGHGVGHDDRKDRILRFFQIVDKGLMDLLADEEAPLVLAGVDYLLPIFRKASSYKHIVDDVIVGNPDLVTPEELHRNAWEIVQPLFAKDEEEAAEQFNHYKNINGHATGDIKKIVPAAYFGQVDQLFIIEKEYIWGSFDPETGEVEFHDRPGPESQELLDVAAAHTLMNGGKVFSVSPESVPSGERAAALLRWPKEGDQA
jgi:hypothetical protein